MTDSSPGPLVCSHCGTHLAPSMLACPACQTLVHSEHLKVLASQAEAAAAGGDRTGEMARWREALELLPATSRQHETVLAKIEVLARAPAAGPSAPAEGSFLKRSWGAIVAVIILLATKGKFLIGGLLKLPTLLSMMAAFGVYWTMWGWKFALGIILTTYVHEMGHVAALVRYGIKASAPMFIPGLGAYVRLHQHPATVREDARVGLAGPVWGLAAGLICYGVGRYLESNSWLAIAHVTAVINLFNLAPIWQLDGGRAFNSLSTTDRWLAVAIIAVAWFASGQGLVVLLGLVAAWQAFRKNPVPSDPGALALFGGLVLALAWMASIEVPIVGMR